MVFIGDVSNQELSEKLGEKLGLSVIYPDIHIFPDGEQRIYIQESLGGEDAIVLKSLTPPVDSNFMQLLLELNALRESSSGMVTVVIPYLGYQRADHTFRVGEAASLRVVIDSLESQKIDRVILLDPHSVKIPEMFTVPTTDLSALSLFADKIRQIVPDLSTLTVVSPDMGGIRRIKLISEMLGVEYGMIEKDRDVETGNIKVAGIHGAAVRETVCIVDDMISSGKTMVQAINAYHNQGAENIYAFATHPVLSENSTDILENSPVKKVFVTDSIGIPQEKLFSKLEVLSVAELMAAAIK